MSKIFLSLISLLGLIAMVIIWGFSTPEEKQLTSYTIEMCIFLLIIILATFFGYVISALQEIKNAIENKEK